MLRRFWLVSVSRRCSHSCLRVLSFGTKVSGGSCFGCFPTMQHTSRLGCSHFPDNRRTGNPQYCARVLSCKYLPYSPYKPLAELLCRCSWSGLVMPSLSEASQNERVLMGTPNREPHKYSRNIVEYRGPARYIPMIFLRNSWGSLFGGSQ